ncbi:MAG: sulfatase-like hydrolase/transferase [Candidatus Hydrogenedentes bacterium]|nr:sulfatase-like hydrolase/transferase [Candidatus Hydrogenedentota bacterium]
MDRREFLSGAGTSLMGASLLMKNSYAAEDARPNILWLTCEDTSPHLGCFGYPEATTPNLDKLAADGARYPNAFSVSGVCAPSRSCLITGIYPNTLGTQHMRCNTPPPPHVKCFPEYLQEVGYYCTNNVKTDYQFDPPKSAWNECSRQAHWRNRPDENQPFFAVFNQTITHESRIGTLFESDEVLRERMAPFAPHDPDALELPPYFPDTPIIRRHWAHYFDLVTIMDKWAGGLLQQLEEDGLADNTVVFFYGDHGVGLPWCKRWLYDRGLHVPLIIRWPGKIPPGTLADELVSFVDFAPTVLSITGTPIPEHMQGRPFLGNAERPPRNYIFAARDRMDERYDIIRAIRDKRFKYIRNYESYRPYDQYLVYPESFPVMQEMRRVEAAGKLEGAEKLFFADRKPLEELYDAKEDPHEIVNIADNPDVQGHLKRLREALEVFLDESNDTGFIPEMDLKLWLDGEWPGPPDTLPVYKIAGEGNIFGKPLKHYVEILNGTDRLRRLRAIKTLGLVSEAVPLLQDALTDYDSAVAHWAAISLGHSGATSPEVVPALLKALERNEISAKLGAARGLVLTGHVEEAMPVLKQAITHENEFARLSAVETLEIIGVDYPGVRKSLQTVMKEKGGYPRRVAAPNLGIKIR